MPVLDLRHTKCPLNFVKAKLAAEKLSAGQTLVLWLAAGGDSALNVPQSLIAEGYQVVQAVAQAPHPSQAETLCLQVSKP
jgi:TusA-related sulfurtransferase